MAYLWSEGTANLHMAVGWNNCSNLPHDVQLVQVMLDRLLSYMEPGTFTVGRSKERCPPPATDGYYDAKLEQAIKSFQHAWNVRRQKGAIVFPAKTSVSDQVDPSPMVYTPKYIHTIVALNVVFRNWYGGTFGTYVNEQEWSIPNPLLGVLKSLARIPAPSFFDP